MEYCEESKYMQNLFVCWFDIVYFIKNSLWKFRDLSFRISCWICWGRSENAYFFVMEIFFSLPTNIPYFQANLVRTQNSWQHISCFSGSPKIHFCYIQWTMDLIILKHVVKGFAELIRHLLNFELFTVNLILNVVNPIMRRKKNQLI